MTEHHPRLLLAGVGPLPPEQPDRLYAPGLRTWGMARELARVGHPIRLVCAGFGEESSTVMRYDLTPGEPVTLPDGLRRMAPKIGGLPTLLATEAREWGADAAVGTTDLMNHALATSGLDLPLWLDFNGDPMAERQLLAKVAADDAGLDEQWALMAPALARADRVSGCSTDQCAALLGELATVGRLGRHTADHRLVFYVPTWYDWHPPWPDGTTGADGPLLRGGAVPAGAFLVIQTGGFNTWLDVETLFAALEAAMAANQQVHFAATGGAIQGHYVEGYERFEREIKSSRYNNRYHILGWRPLGELPRLLAEADLAINLDRPGPEGILGCRNRMLDWVAAGVPTVTTPGCELAVELADGGFVTLTPHGNPAAAARAILAVAADPEPYRAAARRGAAWLARERTATVCMRPILEWAAAPQSALDLQAWRSGEAEPPRLWRRASQAPENLAAMRRQAQKAAWLEQKLARMEGSRWVRLALWLRGRDDLEPPSGGW